MTSANAPKEQASEHLIGALDRIGKLLWRRALYRIEPKPDLEKDVQGVFITKLVIEAGELIATDERGARFAVDLRSHAVRKLRPDSSPPQRVRTH